MVADTVTCRGQSIKIILGAVIGPKYAFMTNTLPASAHVETADLISFFIFLALFGQYSVPSCNTRIEQADFSSPNASPTS
jgi:hypothetical protein